MALQLEIVTPEQRVLSMQCDEVRLPGADGSFGIRPGHTPLVAALGPGELTIIAGGSTQRFAVGEGFAEVSNDRVRALVEEAVRAEELDPQRTVQELTEQRKKLQAMDQTDPAYELERAHVERAAARAFVAGRR
jgi:F-type H+-transporting ATPase subunit epsilon